MSGRRYVRPNKLQGNCVTCRNFHSALSNAIRNRWTCCNINLTFYGPGQGSLSMRPQSSAGQRADSCRADQGCWSHQGILQWHLGHSEKHGVL
ncbi:uncharacterized protein LOC120453668 isoform X2 [Drosophila santomea]|uniref:uncharacterized protein LOC120453668 isoform X2 n=1 Tax=Drosophila santomea TaxID=129105 RepID=UPI001954A96C|nr:uncharacterized protein LOC120453668 isoform X2 [Drosophila santomea]